MHEAISRQEPVNMEVPSTPDQLQDDGLMPLTVPRTPMVQVKHVQASRNDKGTTAVSLLIVDSGEAGRAERRDGNMTRLNIPKHTYEYTHN